MPVYSTPLSVLFFAFPVFCYLSRLNFSSIPEGLRRENPVDIRLEKVRDGFFCWNVCNQRWKNEEKSKQNRRGVGCLGTPSDRIGAAWDHVVRPGRPGLIFPGSRPISFHLFLCVCFAFSQACMQPQASNLKRCGTHVEKTQQTPRGHPYLEKQRVPGTDPKKRRFSHISRTRVLVLARRPEEKRAEWAAAKNVSLRGMRLIQIFKHPRDGLTLPLRFLFVIPSFSQIKVVWLSMNQNIVTFI